MQQPDRITTAEVMRRINRHERMMFVDARSRESFMRSEEIISHAMRVPPGQVAAFAGRIPRNPLVVYCDSEHQLDSLNVARELIERGFPEVRVLDGGFEAWKTARGWLVSKPAGEDVEIEARPTAPATPKATRNVPEYSPSEGVTSGTEPVTPTARVYSEHHRPSHP